MNDQTANLLAQLAQKLGTTTEYLWGILLRQAPISATIDLFLSVLFLVVPFIIYRVHLRLTAIPEGESYDGYDNNESYPILMIVAAFISFILIIITLINLSNIINGYFNPEYWALKELLDAIKPSN